MTENHITAAGGVAQVLAQANLDGGGDSNPDRMAKTPLPPSKRQQSGGDLEQAQKKVQALEAQLEDAERAQAAIEAGEKSIATSTKLAGEVEGVLSHSRDAVMQSRHGVNDITESVSEQKVASTEIAQSMERIANMVEETNAAARSVSTSTGDLRTLSQNLAQAVSGFRVA